MDFSKALHSVGASLWSPDAPKESHSVSQPKTGPAVPGPVQTSSFATPYAVSTTPIVSDGDHNNFYDDLKAKTDFTTSPTFVAIGKHMDLMATLNLDPKTKFTIALKEAQTQESIQPTAVNDVFEACKNTLKDASDRFAMAVANNTASQVDQKKTQADQLGEQIKSLQAQQTALISDSFANQQKIQTAQHNFDIALKTRSAEIDQEQAKYATLLA